MELNVVYFYTASILHWKKLLKLDKYKEFIISSLDFLAKNNLIKVYGFVIMPNHIHLIFESLKKNGKEMPHASLMKHTGHLFLQDLRENHPQVLEHFLVDTASRKYQFWHRDSLPIKLYTLNVFEQKLSYIHFNPLQPHWELAEKPQDYHYSSANFYQTGIDKFGFLTHYSDRFQQ